MGLREYDFMDIELKNRTAEHVVVFWDEMQDDKIKRLFPTSIGTVEESLVLFENSLKADSKSFGKVIYFGEKYIGDVRCYGIDENDENDENDEKNGDVMYSNIR